MRVYKFTGFSGGNSGMLREIFSDVPLPVVRMCRLTREFRHFLDCCEKDCVEMSVGDFEDHCKAGSGIALRSLMFCDE